MSNSGDSIFKNTSIKQFCDKYFEKSGFVTDIAVTSEMDMMLSDDGFTSIFLPYKSKVSYHDSVKREFIYLFRFETAFNYISDLHVYELNGDFINLLMTEHANEKDLSRDGFFHPFFQGSYLQVSVRLNRNDIGTLIEIKDRKNNVLFDYIHPSPDANPLKLLKRHLSIVLEKKDSLHHHIQSITKIIDDIVTKTGPDLFIKKIFQDAELLEQLLITFFFHIPAKSYKRHIKHFFEKLLIYLDLKTVSINEVDHEDDDIYCVNATGQDTSTLVFRKWGLSKKTLLRALHEGLKTIKSKKLDPFFKASFQFVISDSGFDSLQFLEKINCEKNTPPIPVEILVFEKNGRFPHFKAHCFLIDQAGICTEVPTMGYFHPIIEKMGEMRRLKHFNVTLDESASSFGRYTFYGAAINKPEDYRLFHFHLVGSAEEFTLELKETIHTSLNLIRQSLKTAKKIPKWNRIGVKVLPTCSLELDEINAYLKALTADFKSDFEELFIEKMYVLFNFGTSQEDVKSYTFSASHLLFDLPLFHLLEGHALDKHYHVESSRKKRLKSAAHKKVCWAHDIPRILDEAASQICHEWKAKKHEKEGFLPLKLIPESVKTNPKTGALDPEYGELSLVEDSVDWYLNELGAHGVIAGVKVNDLGNGLNLKRLLIISDITQSATITCEQCALLSAAFRYARDHRLPVDWFPVSYGTAISKETGVESLDGCACVAREIILTALDALIPINVVVDNVNVGAQAYWDALAAILPHTSGIVIMTKRGSMTLTGDKALTSALNKDLTSEEIVEKSLQYFPNGLMDIGGYQTVYGPNGKAVIYTDGLIDACKVLLKHHAFYECKKIPMTTYQKQSAEDLKELDHLVHQIQEGHSIDQEKLVSLFEDQQCFSGIRLWKDQKNIASRQPDILHIHQNPATFVQEMSFGGIPILLIVPKTGPLTNSDSEIIAKAINKASHHLPVVIMGSLMGYHSDPGSMIEGQLMSGASILESIVHFHGPLIVVNLGTMIGGICVTFSKKLNKNVTVIAVENSKFQVVGGNIAEKIIFKDTKTAEDFDRLHDAARALKMGAVDYVVQLEELKDKIFEVLLERAA